MKYIGSPVSPRRVMNVPLWNTLCTPPKSACASRLPALGHRVHTPYVDEEHRVRARYTREEHPVHTREEAYARLIHPHPPSTIPFPLSPTP
eukprot:772597-Rhodomonas_salina.1